MSCLPSNRWLTAWQVEQSAPAPLLLWLSYCRDIYSNLQTTMLRAGDALSSHLNTQQSWELAVMDLTVSVGQEVSLNQAETETGSARACHALPGLPGISVPPPTPTTPQDISLQSYRDIRPDCSNRPSPMLTTFLISSIHHILLIHEFQWTTQSDFYSLIGME